MTVAAFKTLGIGNHTEPFIIESLRAAKALTLSLIAEGVDEVLFGRELLTRLPVLAQEWKAACDAL